MEGGIDRWMDRWINQGHTDLNHENDKCLIISETVQATPIQLTVEIVPTKGLYDHRQSNDLDLHSRSQLHLKIDNFFTCTIIVIPRTVAFKLRMMVDLCMAYIYAHARFDDLGLDLDFDDWLILLRVCRGSAKEDRTHDSIAKPLYGLLGEVFELRGMFKWVRRSFMTFVELTFGSNINRYGGLQ